MPIRHPKHWYSIGKVPGKIQRGIICLVWMYQIEQGTGKQFSVGIPQRTFECRIHLHETGGDTIKDAHHVRRERKEIRKLTRPLKRAQGIIRLGGIHCRKLTFRHLLFFDLHGLIIKHWPGTCNGG